MDKPAMEEYRIPWKAIDAWIVVLSIFCLIIVLNIIILDFGVGAFFKSSSNRSLVTLGLFLAQSAVFFVPLYVGVLRKYHLGFKDLGMRWISAPATALWVAKAFAIVILSNFLLSALVHRFGKNIPGFGQQENYLGFFGSSPFDIAVAVLVLMIIAPVVEELFFRGFLLKTLLSRMSMPLASVISSAVFSIAHLQFQSSGIIFILGLVLNWLFIRSKSLVPCIAFHIINNTLAFLVEFWVMR